MILDFLPLVLLIQCLISGVKSMKEIFLNPEERDYRAIKLYARALNLLNVITENLTRDLFRSLNMQQP